MKKIICSGVIILSWMLMTGASVACTDFQVKAGKSEAAGLAQVMGIGHS